MIDPKLVENLSLERKNKNGSDLNITSRCGHEKYLLVFANDGTTFEELFDQHLWLKKPRWYWNLI